MRTRIQRWGHSLALRIPKPFAAEAGLDEAAEVDLTLAKGRLIVAPAAKAAPRLEALLARVTRRNRHGAVGTGARRGREAW